MTPFVIEGQKKTTCCWSTIHRLLGAMLWL